ncbi:UNVERIFIED_CONTAM: hypothetical protein K2H54_042174 [Gekko kuhli]
MVSKTFGRKSQMLQKDNGEKAGDQYRLLDLEPMYNDETEQEAVPEMADSEAIMPEIQSSTTQEEEESENEKTGGLDRSVTDENPGPHLQYSLQTKKGTPASCLSYLIRSVLPSELYTWKEAEQMPTTKANR